MTSTNQQDSTTKLNLAELDVNEFSLEELLDFARAAESRVKAGIEQEQIRLDAEYTALSDEIASWVIANGERTETALWAGYKAKPRHTTVAGVTYTVNVSLTDVKRFGELKAAKATADAAKVTTPVAE